MGEHGHAREKRKLLKDSGIIIVPGGREIKNGGGNTVFIRDGFQGSDVANDAGI